VLRPPFVPALAAAMDRRDARRAADKPYPIEPAPVEMV
jgi:hypothetical protein